LKYFQIIVFPFKNHKQQNLFDPWSFLSPKRRQLLDQSWVEGTMSQYDRRTGVKHLRFRGLTAVHFCAVLKATGLNILRAAAVRKARKRKETGLDHGTLGAMHVFILFKERVEILFVSLPVELQGVTMMETITEILMGILGLTVSIMFFLNLLE
jgi:hypothetical protein